jgi:hypothetical protein
MEQQSPEFLKIMEFDSDDIVTPATQFSYDPKNEMENVDPFAFVQQQERAVRRTVGGLRNTDSRRNCLSNAMSQIQTEPKRLSKRSQFEGFSHADLAVPRPTPTSIIKTNGSQELGSVLTGTTTKRFGPRVDTNVEDDVSVFISNLIRNSHLSPSAGSVTSDQKPHYSPKNFSDKKLLGANHVEIIHGLFSDTETSEVPDQKPPHHAQIAILDPKTWKSPSSKMAPEKLTKLRPRGEVQHLSFAQPAKLSNPEINLLSDRQRLDAPCLSGLSLSRPSLSKKQDAQGSPFSILNEPRWEPNHESLLGSIGSSDQDFEGLKQEETSLHDLLSGTAHICLSPETVKDQDLNSYSKDVLGQTHSDGESSLFTQLGYSYDAFHPNHPGVSPSNQKTLKQEKLQIRDIQMRSSVGETVRTSLWFGTNSDRSSHISSKIVISRFDTMEEHHQHNDSEGAVEGVFVVAESGNLKKLKNISEFVVSFSPTACGLYSALIQFKSRKKVFCSLLLFSN